jgi:hypothetical protein
MTGLKLTFPQGAAPPVISWFINYSEIGVINQLGVNSSLGHHLAGTQIYIPMC